MARPSTNRFMVASGFRRMFGIGARSMIGDHGAPRKRRARKSSASGRFGDGAGGPLPSAGPFSQGRLEQGEVRRAGLVSGNRAGGRIAEDPVGDAPSDA